MVSVKASAGFQCGLWQVLHKGEVYIRALWVRSKHRFRRTNRMKGGNQKWTSYHIVILFRTTGRGHNKKLRISPW